MNFTSHSVPFRLCALRPWRRGFMTTTGVTLILFIAIQLWNTGWADFAFISAFLAVWALTSILWSNDEYIEESNGMLAGIMDQNFDHLHQRLKRIENELQLRGTPKQEDTHRAA